MITDAVEVPDMTKGRAVLVSLMDQYLRGLLDPFVTLLEVHKLMYFMQKAGEPLELKFEKGTYGPYSENLRHVLRPLEGHLVSGYKDGGDAPGKQLNLVPGAVEDAAAFLNGYPDTERRLEKVTQLVDGFESSFGLELLSTVHWVASDNASHTDDEVITYTYAWGPRKRQFTERQIRLALRVLDDNGWFQASPKVGGP